jgi:endonuclease YncB( thermonuclease family)
MTVIGWILLIALSSCSKPKRETIKESPPSPTAAPPAPENKECVHDTSSFRCVKFIKNYDADTITVQIPQVHPLIGDKISVRVRGIDSAEMKGKSPCEKARAKEAQKLVERSLKSAKRIHLTNVERDKYFRILADVEVDGQYIKDILIQRQLAYEYHGQTKRKVDWCKMGLATDLKNEW